jgi:hypothetical protein
LPSGARTGARVAEIPLPSGERIPVLGRGTWGDAEDPRRRASEIAALRHGLDLRLTADLTVLAEAFPPPDGPRPLEVL